MTLHWYCAVTKKHLLPSILPRSLDLLPSTKKIGVTHSTLFAEVGSGHVEEHPRLDPPPYQQQPSGKVAIYAADGVGGSENVKEHPP